jgi:hypothetical protein
MFTLAEDLVTRGRTQAIFNKSMNYTEVRPSSKAVSEVICALSTSGTLFRQLSNH